MHINQMKHLEQLEWRLTYKLQKKNSANCYIAECDTSNIHLNLLVLKVGRETVPGLRYIADDPENATLPVILGTSSNVALIEAVMEQ